MYQIAYIGRWETLPETAAAICDYDTSKLEVLLQGGLDLDTPFSSASISNSHHWRSRFFGMMCP